MAVKWITIDPASEQKGREINGHTFEFMERDKDGELILDLIDLNNYTEAEIENFISAYYDSIEELKAIYGKQANWIIAECIFEQTNGLY